ncbi:archaetidylserine decarboxylase [Yokenella regensburgei]|uniref:archaetidylserine decarboxylase n=1 Tax=Yokenella regensburgei TaxID=158877 RepID=UPI000241F5E3|nr:archaetidylserine decarboxylase [Yokenella regensburgei]EHM51831.1 phosphatidylserine decarboxylase [Yokenella regensburgei ATCC 43003]
MLNDLKLSLQYILPKLWLTRLAGWGASKRAGWLTKLVIDLFVKYYKVDMTEAQKPDTASYRTFNDFFVRPLRDDIRPVNTDPNVLVMPADGAISQLGRIEDDKILQAKGHNYTLEALLAGNYQMAGLFRNGTFATTYLSPRDYHRVHMPCNGILREMIYVPGDLFSVNHLTAQNVPNLFARNERVICLFDTEFGPMVQILVGATIVGSIETVWAGTVTPPREGIIKRWTWPDGESEGAVALLKGQEMGRFKLGSTVINLFAPGKVTLVEHLQSMSATKLGQPLAVSTEFTTPAEAEPVVEDIAEPIVQPQADTMVEESASPLANDKKDEG